MADQTFRYVQSTLYQILNITFPSGWLDGTHPTIIGEIVNRTVCINWHRGCNYRVQIKLVNCGSFFLYYLEDSPIDRGSRHVPMRYCSQPDPATITTTTRRPVTAAFEPEEIIHCEGDHACTSVEKSCNSNSCSILCNGEYSCGYTRYLDVI